MVKPGLFGLENSSRDFQNPDEWGKNKFNVSFPASLANYLSSKGLNNIYFTTNLQNSIERKEISTANLFGLDPRSTNLYFSFEDTFTPFSKLIKGDKLPRVDLVTQEIGTGIPKMPLEVKLTALPDNATCELGEENYGTELVIRPDTIVYLACSIANKFANRIGELKRFFQANPVKVDDWTDKSKVRNNLETIAGTLETIVESLQKTQDPFLLQPIWKTNGKKPQLAENCLDVFVWSDVAFTKLCTEIARRQFNVAKSGIDRQLRTMIWLFRMLLDFSYDGQFNQGWIKAQLNYDNQNDKAFAINGKVSHEFMKSPELVTPRVTKDEVKNIILGGGQKFLSPERRFDAILFYSPELFNN